MIDRWIWRNGNSEEGHMNNINEMRKYLVSLGLRFTEHNYKSRYIFADIKPILNKKKEKK